MSKQERKASFGTISGRIRAQIEPEDEIDVICHKTMLKSGGDGTEVWHKYQSLSEVPNVQLDGWEELVVFTDQHIYRWVQVGYNSGPAKVPRSPNLLKTE